MTPVEIVSLLSSSLSVGASLYLAIFKVAKLESRVEIMWGFLMRKMVGDTVASGLLRSESPLQLDVQALEKHMDLVQEVKDWYEKQPKGISDLELFQRLESKFSDRLGDVSIKEKLLPGGCTVAMLFVLRPESEMFKRYDTASWHKKE